ncbi:flagellar assembly protein FliW [Metabacillus hrfriensis]|uniref:Flagellar assembly protein FliW n=1 Tax=Metabacillus hrfriensis TaxID=3048891 RepID=A0ACD4RAP1_9BACI|nr:flagellar assembly protein FliW [Metabacillus sp. CT-WN-B3]UOK57790.1 flagellar assembly protein FliW [Bacillus sp. OVS6]WHZ57514.1 flagellar assembly protein FliW [Metabacillus sp. CT-WN-B3]
MLIQTKYHGEATINEAHKITFEHGIPGFLEEKNYILLPLEEGSSFFILQSIQSQNTAFVVTSPFFFFKDYEFDLDESTKELLMIESPNDVEVYVILTVSDPFTNSTANLQGPLILNKGKRLGKQLILNKTEYTTKHCLWEGA